MIDKLSINVESVIRNDELYPLIVSSMFKKIKNRFNKAVFALVYLTNYKQVDVAHILGVTETTISRRIIQIRKDLWEYNPKKWRLNEQTGKWEYIANCKEKQPNN